MPKKSRRDRASAPADRHASSSELTQWIPAASLALYSFLYLLIYFQSPLPVYRQQPADRLTVLFTILGNYDTVLATWADLLIDPLPFFAQRTPILLATIFLFGMAVLIGRFLLGRIGLRSLFTRLETFVLAAALGMATLSLWTFLVGFAGFLHSPIIIAAPLVLLAAAGLFDWYRQSPVADETKGELQPATPWAWIAAALPIVACTLLGGMMPPYEYDVLEYHLQLPTEWLASGRIAVESHNAYSGLPMAAEMFALLPMTLWPSDQAWFVGALIGKTLISLFAPLTALAAYCASKRVAGSYAGQIAAVLVIGTPWIVFVAVYGLVDGVWAFYGLAAVFVAIVWFQQSAAQDSANVSDRVRLALLIGLTAGMATACKYPALP
ncbi:MAG: hypothetical protein ACIALR_07110, partial [Blastopirellula sp. JB062]